MSGSENAFGLTPPQPRTPVAATAERQTTLVTADGVPIQVALSADDLNVLVSGPANSVLIPVTDLTTPPV